MEKEKFLKREYSLISAILFNQDISENTNKSSDEIVKTWIEEYTSKEHAGSIQDFFTDYYSLHFSISWNYKYNSWNNI